MSLLSLIYARIALNGDENDLTQSMKPFVHPEVKVIYEDFLLPPSSYELPDNAPISSTGISRAFKTDTHDEISIVSDAISGWVSSDDELDYQTMKNDLQTARKLSSNLEKKKKSSKKTTNCETSGQSPVSNLNNIQIHKQEYEESSQISEDFQATQMKNMITDKISSDSEEAKDKDISSVIKNNTPSSSDLSGKKIVENFDEKRAKKGLSMKFLKYDENCAPESPLTLSDESTAPDDNGAETSEFDEDSQLSGISNLTAKSANVAAEFYLASNDDVILKLVEDKMSQEEPEDEHMLAMDRAVANGNKLKRKGTNINCRSSSCITDITFDNSSIRLLKRKRYLPHQNQRFFENTDSESDESPVSPRKLRSPSLSLPSSQTRTPWSAEEDEKLTDGLKFYSKGTKFRWAMIKKKFFINSYRTSVNIKDRVRTLIRNEVYEE